MQVHEKEINYFGWSGSGYIIENPETGSGAYKITGGANGGFLSEDWADFLGFIAFALGLVSTIFPAIYFLVVILTLILIVNSLLDYWSSPHRCEGLGAVLGLSITAALAGLRAKQLSGVVLMYLGLVSGKGASAAAKSSYCKV